MNEKNVVNSNQIITGFGEKIKSHDEQFISVIPHVENKINVKEFGMNDDGVTDNLSIFNSLKSKYPNSILYFPIQTTNKKYYFGGGRPNLGGVKIKTDEGITFKLDVNPNLKEMILLNDVIFENTSHKTSIKKPQNTNISTLFNMCGVDVNNNEKYVKLDMTTFDNKIFNLDDYSLSLEGTTTKTPNTITWVNNFTGNPQVIKPNKINEGSCYELSCLATQVIAYGFLIETIEGNIIQIKNMSSTNIWNVSYRYKDNKLFTDYDKVISTPNGGSYGQILGNDITLGFYIDKNKNVKIMVNDYTLLSYNSLIGEVSNVYFLLGNEANTKYCTFKDAIEIKNYKYNNSKSLKLCLMGDSISYGAWNTIDPATTLKLMAQNIQGVGYVEVDNISVSGWSSSNWVNDVNNHNFSEYDYVLCMIGTNDIQGNTPISSYTNNLKTIANKIKNDNSNPIFQIPPIFTNSTQSSVIGVTTNNYANHSKYVHALKMFCIDNNYDYGNARRNFGCNLKWYGDNIHPTEEGQIAIMKSWCEVLSMVLNS